MKKVFYAIILLALLQSCVSQQVAIRDYSTEHVAIPFQATEIYIKDSRTNKQPMNWDLPAIATKQLSVTGSPELTSADIQLLTSIVKKSESANGTPAKITVRLLEGTCNIYADWSKAKEFTKVAIELEVEELNGQRYFKSNAEVFYEYGTLNALEDSVVKAYKLALKNATHQSLKQLPSQVN
ncbi:hypothetical protein [Pontibacter sp. H249]|uniref:hypothetical protein n=1 Tax=Pontibacter sp. H249 TaxID=3133420 RepID=UPI0030C48C9C